MSDIDEKIEESAKGPKRVRAGNTEVEQQSVKDQIAADNHLERKKAATSGSLPCRFGKLRSGPA